MSGPIIRYSSPEGAGGLWKDFWKRNVLSWERKEKVWQKVKVVRMKVSWYDYEWETNREEWGEDMLDEMSQEVDSRDDVMHNDL